MGALFFIKYMSGADATHSAGWTFRYSFECMGRMAAWLHEIQMRVNVFVVETEFDIFVNNSLESLDAEISTMKLMEAWNVLTSSSAFTDWFNKVVKVSPTFYPFHPYVFNETKSPKGFLGTRISFHIKCCYFGVNGCVTK